MEQEETKELARGMERKRRQRISRARAISSKVGTRRRIQVGERRGSQQQHHSSLGYGAPTASRALAKAQLAILRASRWIHKGIKSLCCESLIMLLQIPDGPKKRESKLQDDQGNQNTRQQTVES